MNKRVQFDICSNVVKLIELNQYVELDNYIIEENINEKILNSASNIFWDAPLIFAASEKKFECMKILLKHNCVVNINMNMEQETPLHKSITNFECTKLLLEHGADVNVSNIGGTTPMMYAICNDNLEIVKLLFQYQYDINLVDIQDYNILHYAAKNNSINVLKYLIC